VIGVSKCLQAGDVHGERKPSIPHGQWGEVVDLPDDRIVPRNQRMSVDGITPGESGNEPK
jgi:hypothetical protein